MPTTVFIRNTRRTTVPPEFEDGLLLDYFSDKDRNTIALDVDELIETVGMPPPIAVDLLLLSAAIYTADKKAPRAHASDHWSRSFHLSVPVTDPSAWMR